MEAAALVAAVATVVDTFVAAVAGVAVDVVCAVAVGVANCAGNRWRRAEATFATNAVAATFVAGADVASFVVETYDAVAAFADRSSTSAAVGSETDDAADIVVVVVDTEVRAPQESSWPMNQLNCRKHWGRRAPVGQDRAKIETYPLPSSGKHE